MATILFYALLFWPLAHCVPTSTQSSSQLPNAALFHPSASEYTAFLWSSIGLAVVTAFSQGLVSALTYMTEASNSWTFRFRLAKAEHWWWTLVTVLLVISLAFNIISFASGNTTEAVSVLIIASTTLLTLVRYMLPAWRSRKFIENRWLAWTGPSRTAIPRNVMSYCGNYQDWERLASAYRFSQGKTVPSDDYGWHLLPLKGIRQDPTDILNTVNTNTIPVLTGEIMYIFDDGDGDSENVSLFWGTHSGFLPRISRSVSSIPTHLLKSHPITFEGYAGEGICLGMGILGRNKGLKPWELVFNMTKSISTSLENKSTWRPRPAKTLRSYYHKTLQDVYGGLGEAFVNAAVELCLLLMDADEHAVRAWLKAKCEHQSYQVNQALFRHGAEPEELTVHYRSSYVSMIISLNNMKDKQIGHRNHGNSQAKRPDIICLALLLKAQGASRPKWWDAPEINAYRAAEKQHLDGDWYSAAAKLLGLESFPPGLEDGVWDSEEKCVASITNSPVVT